MVHNQYFGWSNFKMIQGTRSLWYSMLRFYIGSKSIDIQETKGCIIQPSLPLSLYLVSLVGDSWLISWPQCHWVVGGPSLQHAHH